MRKGLDFSRFVGDIEVGDPVVMQATRLDPDNAWVRFAMASIERSTGQAPALLPNRWLTAQRCLRRRRGAAHAMGAAQLPGLLAACAGPTSA